MSEWGMELYKEFIMADFIKAFKRTMTSEGIYSNDKDDPGGETVYGISRVWNPQWGGWSEVDKLKKENQNKDDLIRALMDSIIIRNQREIFYEIEYWNKFKGGQIQNQFLAEAMFDCSVHHGVSFTVKSLQKSLNLILKYSLKVDGKFGSNTLDALKKAEQLDYDDTLRKMLLVHRGNLFIILSKKSEYNWKRLKGYFNRIF